MPKSKYTTIRPRKHTTSARKWWVLGGLLLVVGIFAVLELTNTTYIFHKKKVPLTIPVDTTKSIPAQTKSTPSNSSNTSGQTTINQNKIPSPSTDTSSTLVQPYGTFVSNHMPGQNGSDMNEQSACDTTPGATCYIQLTDSGGKSTKLPSQTVGNDGSTIWNWDANILTSGDWQVTAIASLNGQTKSATDPTKLVIK